MSNLLRDFEDEKILTNEHKAAGIIAIISISIFSISYFLGGTQITTFLKNMTLATVALVSLYVAWKKLRFGTTEKVEYRFADTKEENPKTVEVVNTGNTTIFVKSVLYFSVEKKESEYHVHKRRGYIDDLLDSGKKLAKQLEPEQENIMIQGVRFESWNGETVTEIGSHMPMSGNLFEIDIDEEEETVTSDPIASFLALIDYQSLSGTFKVSEKDMRSFYNIPEVEIEDVIKSKKSIGFYN